MRGFLGTNLTIQSAKVRLANQQVLVVIVLKVRIEGLLHSPPLEEEKAENSEKLHSLPKTPDQALKQAERGAA